MSDLIVYLSPTAPGPSTEYRYAQTRDGQTVLSHGSALASTLPTAGVGQDVVAIVPGRLLSWHAVDLPRGTVKGSATRLRAVLDGLLEDRLLDDPQQLHFAIAPQSTPGATPDTFWVAACDKAWLQAALAPLEAAARPVSRIVPEFAPLLAQDTTLADEALYALGDPTEAWLVHAHKQGVTVLPLMPAVVQQWKAQPSHSASGDETTTRPGTIRAEPAVAALANHLFQHQVTLQQAPERWVLALQSPWDLAQFDLANSNRQRAVKKLGDLVSTVLHAPHWRLARWGAVLLAAANLMGLNAWAWKEKSALQQKRADVQAVLTQTFPQVKVVIDAPVQMSREVALLRQAAGAASRQDLESLLTAVGTALPPTSPLDVTQVDYGDGELRLKAGALRDGKSQDLPNQLQALGFTARLEGDTLSVKPTPGSEATR